MDEVSENNETVSSGESSDAEQEEEHQTVGFVEPLEECPRLLPAHGVHGGPGYEAVGQQHPGEGCPEVLAAVRLDEEVGEDVVGQDHGAHEGKGEVVEVAGQEGDDGAAADDVDHVETHPGHQLAVGRPLCRGTVK